MNNQEKRKSVALPEDLAEDIDYIAEMLSQRTGAKIGRTNAIRAAAKAWFDAENNGWVVWFDTVEFYLKEDSDEV